LFEESAPCAIYDGEYQREVDLVAMALFYLEDRIQYLMTVAFKLCSSLSADKLPHARRTAITCMGTLATHPENTHKCAKLVASSLFLYLS
ncbi:hypothetical protein KIPB_013763, partial [Kipferlia bialata]